MDPTRVGSSVHYSAPRAITAARSCGGDAAYFSGDFDARVPDPGARRGLFSFQARTLRDRTADGRFSVLNLCRSYRINATLLNCDLTLAEACHEANEAARLAH